MIHEDLKQVLANFSTLFIGRIYFKEDFNMKFLSKLLWTMFSWISGVVVGIISAVGFYVYLETECDGFTSKLFRKIAKINKEE